MKRRGISTAIAGILLIVGLVIGAGATYLVIPQSGGTGATATTTTTVNGTGAANLCNSGQTIKIGGLIDQTDGLAAQGTAQKNTMELAFKDINSWLASAGCSLKFGGTYTDDHGDATTSLQNLQALTAQGVQVNIGPTFSDAVVADLSYADSHHVVLISPSSTAASLAINNDYLFRIPPTDKYQAQADVAILQNYSVKAIIVIHHVGTYASGLANATAAQFAAAGGNVVDNIGYPKDTTDYTPVVTQMLNDWNTAVSKYGASHVAIYTVSFEEIGRILAAANQSSTTSALLNTPLPWFGDDGQAQDTLLTNSTVGPYMAKIRIPATIFAAPGFTGGAVNFRAESFLARYKSVYGIDLSNVGYSYASYDATWIAAISILAGGANDGTKVQSLITTVANNYFGLSGWTTLGPSGDGIPLSGYQIWSVVKSSTAPPDGQGGPLYWWVPDGAWSYNTNTISGTFKP